METLDFKGTQDTITSREYKEIIEKKCVLMWKKRGSIDYMKNRVIK